MRYPVMVEFYADASDDAWLRARIRGEAIPPPRLQRVVVEREEGENIVYRVAALKHARNLPFGGAQLFRVVKSTDGTYRPFVEGVDR